ncbi:MAG: hypothetical protein AAFV85_03045 [Cyanobacteria bacterium J06634_6]
MALRFIGATVHISNIAGLSGTPWLATPLLWRCMDIALLVFDLVAAVSLWKGLGWSVWFVFGGIKSTAYFSLHPERY